MWIRSYSKVYPDIKKDEIWRLWTDVNNWHLWDPDIEYGRIEEPFAVGSHFFFKPKNMSEVALKLVEVEPKRKYTDHCRFFGANLYGTHEMEEARSGLKLTTTIRISGPLCLLWAKLVGQGIVETLPEQMESLINLARSKNGR